MIAGSPTARPDLRRTPRRDGACMVPQAGFAPGVFEVDATWGTVQPIALAPGVRTVGELELIDHVAHEGSLVDTRLAHFYEESTIPGATSIPHEDVLARIDELDRRRPTVLFCNGPQCAATPDAIRSLLAAGHPPSAILYYRGGMHDWVTLGYPVVPGASA